MRWIFFFYFSCCSWISLVQGNANELLIHQLEAEKVLNKIVTAIGETREVPLIEVRGGRKNIAEYNAIEKKIYVDQLAMKVCSKLGFSESAVAFLIGHELAHYYQQDKWAVDSTSFLSTADEFKEHQEAEQEADIYGAFISHLAGYETTQVIPPLLHALYQAYEVKAQSNHPSIEIRQQVAEEVCEKISSLIGIHQAANCAMAIGDYNNALATYEYLAQFVGYRELYNNIGVASLSMVLSVRDQSSLAFLYPIAIEQNIPLRTASEYEKLVLLQKATTAFKRATDYGAFDFSTHLNLACVYEISQQEADFLSLLNFLKSNAYSPNMQSKTAILEGIYTAKFNKKKAIKLFSTAIKQSDNEGIKQLGTYNKKVVKKNSTIYPFEQELSLDLNTNINGINLFTYRATEGAKYTLKNQNLLIANQKAITIYSFLQNNYTIHITYTSSSDLSTKDNIKKGNTFDDLLLIYGEPSLSTLTTHHGYYVTYLELGLFFKLDQRNTIEKWGTFLLGGVK